MKEKAHQVELHQHRHALNRFSVIPTPLRLQADPERTGRGVTIALLDSGFSAHPDLTRPMNRVVAYVDVNDPVGPASLPSNGSLRDSDWHGMQTSVVAAGNGYLSGGFYRGLAAQAQVVLIKVSEAGRITEENIGRGIEWVIRNKDRYKIRIVSLSLGGDAQVPYKDSVADQAAEEAVRQGLVVVAAAGNSGCTERHQPVPPANAPSVITVGGYDDGNLLDNQTPNLYCSSFGPTIDGLLKPEIVAPAAWVAAPILLGTSFYRKAEALSELASAPDYMLPRLARNLAPVLGLPSSIQREPAETIRSAVEELLRESKIVATHYQRVDGTSFAAPIVASIVAQMLEVNLNLTPAVVKQLLVATADRIPGVPLLRQGYGVVNARRAVEAAAREMHALDPATFRPPRVEGGCVVFFYHNDAAQTVGLAGDFNGWNPAHMPFVRAADGIWCASLPAPPPGRYEYKFVVDGDRWAEDPSNGLTAPDAYGGLNSVLHLGGQ